MDDGYWTSRKREALVMARNASSAEARLIHYEMAGRYSLKAAHGPPFRTIAAAAPEADREALRPTAPQPRPDGGR